MPFATLCKLDMTARRGSRGGKSGGDGNKRPLADSGTSIRDCDHLGTGVKYFQRAGDASKSRFDYLDWIREQARASGKLVAGTDGKITNSCKRPGGRVPTWNVASAEPGAEVDVCISWRNGKGCKCAGHWVQKCPKASVPTKAVQATGDAP